MRAFSGVAELFIYSFIYLFIQFISPQLEKVKTISTK